MTSLAAISRSWLGKTSQYTRTGLSKPRRITAPKKLISYRSYSSQGHSNPIKEVEAGSDKLANVARVRADGSTGRFFKKTNVIKVPTGWEVEIDGYCIASKEGVRIQFPSEELAVATAADWEYMHRRVDPRRMPLYTLASLATDMTRRNREMHRETLLNAFEDDILGPRTESPTPHLEQLWREFHDPVIDWFRKEFDVTFTVDDNMMTKQPRKSLRLMKKGILALDDWSLVGLVTSVDTTLSLVTSLALWNGIASVEQATAVTRSEYVIAEASWGDVPGNTDLRRAHFLMDLHSANFFLRTLPTPTFNNAWIKSLPALPMPATEEAEAEQKRMIEFTRGLFKKPDPEQGEKQ